MLIVARPRAECRRQLTSGLFSRSADDRRWFQKSAVNRRRLGDDRRRSSPWYHSTWYHVTFTVLCSLKFPGSLGKWSRTITPHAPRPSCRIGRGWPENWFWVCLSDSARQLQDVMHRLKQTKWYKRHCDRFNSTGTTGRSNTENSYCELIVVIHKMYPVIVSVDLVIVSGIKVEHIHKSCSRWSVIEVGDRWL